MSKNLIKTFLLGILAGAAIGLGGFLYIICTSFVCKELGSLCFAIGLWLVCFFSLQLYTGKIGFAFEQKRASYALDLIVMLLGNTLGAYLFGLLMRLTTITSISQVEATINKVCEVRNVLANETWYNALFLSIMCGVLVFLAVYFYKNLKPLWLKSLALVICVFLFVYLGFEHVIANIFYFSFGNKNEGAYALNTFICLIGNSLGALGIWYATKLAKIQSK